ncbi:MAG: LysM peptidoglycan-binding domain-containing protein, partial [Acidimicrobiia bacterium]
MPAKNRFRALAVGAGLALLVTLFSVDYTVERGDTLGKIAREHGISLAELVEANDITNPNLIHIGQVLIVPGEEGESEVIHIVARGETLGKIARKYGSSVSALAEKNGISRPNLIRIGQNLIVSGSASVGSSGETSGGDDVKSPSTPATHSGSHIVQRGESIESIAAEHGVTVEQIARANGILN